MRSRHQVPPTAAALRTVGDVEAGATLLRQGAGPTSTDGPALERERPESGRAENMTLSLLGPRIVSNIDS